jgi:dTDP-4-dehydrorhamnose reductase
MPRYLILGREGQLARALHLLGKSLTGMSKMVLDFLGSQDIDLADTAHIQEKLRGQPKVDLLINAAAYTAVDEAESEGARADAINHLALREIGAYAAAQDIPIIHLSTDYVFNGSLTRPYREEDEPHPLNVYGHTKLAGERALAASGARHVILRTSWVYSPWGTNFVRTMERLRAREELRVVDDQRGAPTYALDIAEAVLAIAERLRADPESPKGVFHLTAQGETSWYGFAQAIFAMLGADGGPVPRLTPIPASEYPTPARRPGNSRLDGSALRSAWGLQLPPWQNGLERCVERMRSERI